MRKKMRRLDLWIIFGLLLISALICGLMLFFRDEGNQVVVTVDGKEIFRCSLDDAVEYVLPTEKEGRGHVLCVADGKASVSSAPCRDQICVHQRTISYVGDSIICLPYRMVVTIVQEKH